MSQKAIEIFDLFKNNPQKLEGKLISIFKNKNLKIKEIKLFKKHWVIKDQWKISALIHLENNLPEKILLEIHDNPYCFKRIIFALVNLRKIVPQPPILKIFRKPKMILREFVKAERLYEMIVEKRVSLRRILKINKKIANLLAALHSYKLSAVPKFLFKEMNKKLEEETLKKTLTFITPEIETLRKRVKTVLSSLFKKMSKIDRENKISLIHSDPNLSHFLLDNKNVYLMDYDSLEVGNPAKDLGKFIFDLKYYLRKKYTLKKIENIINLFLKEYLKQVKFSLKPDLKTNLAIHEAERAAYILLSKVWDKKTLKKKEIREIKKLLIIQERLLNL